MSKMIVDAAYARGCACGYIRVGIVAWAQQAPPTRIRGTIEAVDGPMLTHQDP